MLLKSFDSGKFKISIFTSIDSIDSKKWEAIRCETMEGAYFRLIEAAKPADLGFRYALIEGQTETENTVCGAMYFQVLKTSAKNFNLAGSFITRIVSRLFFSLFSFRIVICGNLFAVNYPSLWYNPEIISRQEMLRLVSEMEKYIPGSAYLLKDLAPEFTVSEMAKSGWKRYDADLTMELSIQKKWKDRDGYVNSLTRKYRKRALKIIEAGEKLERRKISLADFRNQKTRIRELFTQVAEKQQIRMGMIQVNYFEEYLKRFPEKFSMSGYFFQNNLVAFSSFVDRGKTLEMHYIGIDYNFNVELLLYFNLLMDGIEKAITEEKEILELGRTAREAKANLGGKPVFFNDYFKTRGRMVASLVDRLVRYCLGVMGGSPVIRHPFRK
jgi:hypothetical protein